MGFKITIFGTTILPLLLLVLLAGCNSYRVVQQNVFSDEDGFLVALNYGVAEKTHENTFVSPVTGETMPFKSRLLVLAELPDGEELKAWQCMNFLPRGTMYQTDDEKWKILVEGFSCTLYAQNPENERDYAIVYRGVLCDSPAVEVKKDDRWREIRSPQRVYRGTSR